MLRAEGDWTKASAPAVLADARRLLSAGTLDLSGLARSDSTAVALMLELTRRARAEGKSLAFTSLPPRLERLLEFFGVGPMLGVTADPLDPCP